MPDSPRDRTLEPPIPPPPGRTLAGLTAGLLLLFLALPAGIEAQATGAEREGFWIGFGLGYGSLALDDFPDREAGLSGNLSLGGTIGPRFLLGAGTTGWTKEEDGFRVTLGTLAVLARFYPSAEGDFFLNFGLGGATISLSEGSLSISESGGAAILGVGFDARISPGWSVTPFVNAIGYGFDGFDADVLQFGVGLTHH